MINKILISRDLKLNSLDEETLSRLGVVWRHTSSVINYGLKPIPLLFWLESFNALKFQLREFLLSFTT